MLVFFPVLLLATVLGSTIPAAKRVVDALRAYPVRGGGIIGRNSDRLRFFRSNDEEGESATTMLLQTEAVRRGANNADLPESYSFFLDERYAGCYSSDFAGQGPCNTCWAFSVQKMMQARLCKRRANEGASTPRVLLSPLNLICHVQKGKDVCLPQNIMSALDFIIEPGILEKSFVNRWEKAVSDSWNLVQNHAVRNRFFSPKTDVDWREGVETVANPSNPTREKCDILLFNDQYKENLVRAPEVAASSAPFGGLDLRRRLVVGGPVVATIRLSWEFLIFTGSLFNPSGRMTFCRMFQEADAEDYCDPARKSSWDDAQRQQQVQGTPDGMGREDWEDTWYNHFVTLHGYGSTSDGVKYWVVENSWGAIYANDATLNNNGAGKNYRMMNNAPLNHFVLVADGIAGRGGLEMTSRTVFFALYPKSDSNVSK